MAQTNELLTLVLPLRGRAAFTLRFMQYLDRISFPFRLIIADGSAEVLRSMSEIPERFSNIDCTYKKYPFDATYSDYYRKMVSVLSAVQTPYVSLIDNDCFPVVKGLHDSVRFLERNAGYSTCRGQHIDYMLSPFEQSNGDLLHGSGITIHPDYFDRQHTIWASFEKKHPLERIMDWSHCMNIMHYNVYPTNILIEAWKFISRNDCIDLFFCEIALALNALACGKSKVLDVPFIVRQQNSPESASKEAISHMDILDRMFVEKWTRDINQLIDETAEKAAKTGACKKSEAIEQIRLAIKNHYADRLYTYLAKRDSVKRKADGEDAENPQNIPYIHISGDHQPEDIHPALSGIVEFLGEGEAE